MAAARGEGCSWAQIGAELGVSKQAAQQRFVARPIDALTARLHPIRLVGPPLSRMGFFSRFTTAACDIITSAQEQARQLGHDAVGPAHLLLSLLRDPDGRPTVALRALEIDVEAARRRVLDALGGAQNDADDSPPFTVPAGVAVGDAHACSVVLLDG